MRKQIFSIAVAAAFAIPSLASAEVEVQSIDEGKVLVSYDLKEVSTEQGRAELERQIRRAADRVCGPRTIREAGSFTQSMDNRNCYRAAVERALQAVDSNKGSIAAVSQI